MKEDSWERRYFAASNSGTGFVNYFPRIFGGGACRRLFVVKGGPGTGKSSFMKRMGEMAKENGYDVTYYLCSSDPSSLDGLLIDGLSVGLVDGTAPHTWEPMSIGAFEQLVDLGAFWNGDALLKRRQEIDALAAEKRASYGRVYRYLEAIRAVKMAWESEAKSVLDAEKLSRVAERILLRYAPPPSKQYRETVGLYDSIGMAGRARLDIYRQAASSYFPIEDLGDTAHLLLSRLYDLCRARGISVRISYHPILPHRIDGLELLDNGVVFAVCDEEANEDAIRMRRFVRSESYRALRTSYREGNAACRRLTAMAEKEFLSVRSCHFRLEEIFGETMDFSAKERFERSFAEKLFSMERY